MALTKLIAATAASTRRASRRSSEGQAEVEAVMRGGRAGRLDAGVPGLHPEIIKLLGRLKYRTCYGQNVLNHSIEVARLAALIAAEIGADVNVAKTGGLLHDIGKAVDHEVEGPHARRSAPTSCAATAIAGVMQRVAAHHQETSTRASRR